MTKTLIFCVLLGILLQLTGTRGFDSFAKAGLKMHNRLPERKGNPYKLDRNLCNDAQSYANKLARRNTLPPQHAKGNFGENISWKGPIHKYGGGTRPSDKPSAAVVVKMWYNEKYPGNRQYSRHGFNHFTQVVWAGSKKMCMATAMSKSGAWFTVARYYPQGNWGGQRPANVPVISGSVLCGGHRAKDCASCPNGHGKSWCNGECTWLKNVGKPDVCI